MANIFTIDNGTVACLVEENLEYTAEYCVTRAEFSAQYPSLDLSSIRTMAYEPARSLYHVTDADYNVAVLDSPSSNPVMSYVDSNFDAIKDWMAEQESTIE